MDPFSITAGAVGIAAFATSSIVQLHNLINSLPEADGLVADISSQLTNIERPLAALQQLGISNESMEDLKKAGVPEAVEACNNACDEFEKKLAKWTSRSNTKKLSFRDRFTVGVVKKEQMRTLMTRLDSCGNTVQLAVESTQLMAQMRSEKAAGKNHESVEKQLQALETRIEEHLALTKKQQDEIQARKRELEEGPEDEDDDDDDDQRERAIEEVRKQARILEADQVSSAVIFSQVQSTRSGQDITKIFTSTNSKAWVGLTESVVGKINQRISDVRTEGGSTAYVGVMSGTINL